jgi:hypothetical protein
VIGRVVAPGKNVAGVLYYLFGRGRRDEHVNPHLVGGWEHPATLEPPVHLDEGGKEVRDFRRLVGLLEQPVAAIGKRAPELYVWHCVLRAAPEDTDLGDGAWHDITGRVMDRTGLSELGREHEGVRWVAVHHGDNHVHIVVTLARQDGRRASVNNLYWRIGEALRDIEREYGLRILNHDKTADMAPTQAEMAKAGRAGQSETARAKLRRIVQAAAAAARTDAEFFAAIEARGALARPRWSTTRSGEINGYSVALPGDETADGRRGRRPVWYGGRKLASDLSLPRLRERWAGMPGSTSGSLTGLSMTNGTAWVVLTREALRAARSARSENEFFSLLDRAGLQVRLRSDPTQPGRTTGWSATLPGLVDRAGQPVWFGGGTLDPQLKLGALRARWRADLPGAVPGPDLFIGFTAGEIYAHAARVGQQAAAAIATAKPTEQAAIAWAASDLIAAAAEATGNSELARAAEGFARAARPAWGRTPAPTPRTVVIRTAAYLLASCIPGRYRGQARRTLVLALTGLARTLADMRAAQDQRLQSAAAARSAARLADDAAATAREQAPHSAAAAFPGQPVVARHVPAARQASAAAEPTLPSRRGTAPG